MAQSARGPLATGYSKTSRQLSLSIGAIVYASLYLLYRSLVVRTIKERGLHEKPTKGLQQGRHAGARLSDGHLTQQHLSNSSGAEVTESAGLIAETPTAHRTKLRVFSGEASECYCLQCWEWAGPVNTR
jgi:hypothetical protein